jgi:hypothetical protein
LVVEERIGIGDFEFKVLAGEGDMKEEEALKEEKAEDVEVLERVGI